jgi:hypothetical protein
VVASEILRRGEIKLATWGVAYALLVGLHPGKVRAQTHSVAYPPGWNLVAGPTGSTLLGAVGDLYTTQISGDYLALPPNTALSGCRGYWAYFPMGGSTTFGPDQTNCAATISAGNWVMVGNPVGSFSVQVSAEQVYVYTPTVGYTATRFLAPGTGAWAIASGTVSVQVPGATSSATARASITQPSQPVPTATSSPR